MRTQDRIELSHALEDYLETVYELVRDQKVARVRDIARARGVRAASVTPAMQRLSELGLIRYFQREYIDLTPQGEEEARRILSRHQILTRFFNEVMQISAGSATADACAMEHSLSNEGMDHLVRFLEFLRNCPEGRSFLKLFHRCHQSPGDLSQCRAGCRLKDALAPGRAEESVSLASLTPVVAAKVFQVNGVGEIRDRLLDMGLLPDVPIELIQIGPEAKQFFIRVQGFELKLNREEAQAVLVIAPEKVSL